MKNLKDISSLFIVGIKDFQFTPELQSFLKEYPVSGLALFNSPWDSPDNIWNDRTTCLEVFHEFIHKILDYDVFIAADQEGGRVRRLRGPYLHLPTAEMISEVSKIPEKHDAITGLYSMAAKQMAASKVHLNFAPVCDLRTSESHDVIGDRSYGSKVDEVIKQTQTFCDVFEKEKVHTTLKHLPGHGPTQKDSHDEVASLFKPKEEVMREDFQVFKQTASNASAVMTAHVAYLEDPDRIVSLDPKLIAELKSQMPDSLAWITDDILVMKAVEDRKPCLRAYDAQYDFSLLCGDLDKASGAIDETIRYVEAKLKNFQDEQNLNKRIKRSRSFFKHPEKPSAYEGWSKNIFELEKRGLEFLEQIQS